MNEQKTFFGTSRQLIERIDSLDQKWFVEVWIVKYYFFGIEIFIHKKEVVKRADSEVVDFNKLP
jgi:hypothetical protein